MKNSSFCGGIQWLHLAVLHKIISHGAAQQPRKHLGNLVPRAVFPHLQSQGKTPWGLGWHLGTNCRRSHLLCNRRAVGSNKACRVKSTKHKTTHCATVAEFKIETNYLSSLGRINRLDTNPVFRRHRGGSWVPYFWLLAINGACAYEVMFTLYQRTFRAATKAFSSPEPVVSWSREWYKNYLVQCEHCLIVIGSLDIKIYIIKRITWWQRVRFGWQLGRTSCALCWSLQWLLRSFYTLKIQVNNYTKKILFKC